VATFEKGSLVIWTKGTRRSVLEAILALPRSVRVIAVDSVPGEDEYGRKLPEDLTAGLGRRVEVVPFEKLAIAIGPQPGLPEEYRKLTEASYLSWSPERGHFGYGVPYCALEARGSRSESGRIVAVINNSSEARTAPVPWSTRGRIVDLVANRPVTVEESAKLTFGPLEVRLFLLED
jgi:hypothetical protein